MGSAGYLTSALSIGGSPDTDETEKYDGTAWSETGNMITGRYQLGATGTQNAASIMGGVAPGAISKTEEYDGITWSESSNMITARICPAGVGSQQAALAVGGGTPVEQTCTEEYQKTHSGASYLLTKNIKAQE